MRASGERRVEGLRGSGLVTPSLSSLLTPTPRPLPNLNPFQSVAEGGGAESSEAAATAASELERVFCKADFRRMAVHGQFNLGFIVASLGRDLFIIDQHASDEKFNFERLRATTVLNRRAPGGTRRAVGAACGRGRG